MTTIPSIADSEEDNDSPYLDWDISDAMVRELMEAGDIEGAKAEFGKTLLQSLDSGAFQ